MSGHFAIDLPRTKLCAFCHAEFARPTWIKDIHWVKRVTCSRTCASRLNYSKRTVRGRTTHGLSRTHAAEYRIWKNMRQRCFSGSGKNAEPYRLRGIKVCDRWRTFENFFADMGPRPSKAHSIERINNDGNYEPANCRWATLVEQANNKRSNRVLEFEGRHATVAQWARERGIEMQTLHARLKRGWTVERAISTPTIETARWGAQ